MAKVDSEPKRIAVARVIVRELIHTGLKLSPWKERYPEAFNALLEWEEDMTQHVGRLISGNAGINLQDNFDIILRRQLRKMQDEIVTPGGFHNIVKSARDLIPRVLLPERGLSAKAEVTWSIAMASLDHCVRLIQTALQTHSDDAKLHRLESNGDGPL